MPIKREADRYEGYTQKMRVDSHVIYLRTDNYKDGTLAGISIDMDKQGTFTKSMLSCFCIAVSLALKHGIPLKLFVDEFIFTRFSPNGIVTGHQSIKNCTSVLDLVFRDLAITYLKRDDLRHIPLFPKKET